MSALAIHLNDAGLVVADDSGVLAVEPGFALVEPGRVVTGEDARQQARLKPRRTSSRHWHALSLEPGSAGADIDQSAAALAYAQLENLWRRFAAGVTEVVLVVPGAYRTQELGLILGMAEECGIPVRALVDAAAAASGRPYPNQQLVYLDASLYRVSLTLLEQGEHASIRAEHSLAQTGLASLTDAFAHRIAEAFVKATRFDPFHDAQTEQALYDRLPAWLEALKTEDSAELVLPHEHEEFRVTVERESILGVAAGFYRAVAQLIAQHREPGRPLAVLLAAGLAELPALVAELARLDDVRVESLPVGAAARGALEAVVALPASGAGVKLLKRLPWRAAPAEPAPVVSAAPAAPLAAKNLAPTHIVYGGTAYHVGAAGLVIGREPDDDRRVIVVGEGSSGVSRAHCELVERGGELWLKDLSRYGTFVNERRVAGETALARADVIRIGSPGAELHVVGLEAG